MGATGRSIGCRGVSRGRRFTRAKEEINLRLPRSAIMGRLDDYITRSGYRITPVVLWSGEESDHLKPNPDEVASIHTVSFKELANPSAPQFEEIPESDRKVLS